MREDEGNGERRLGAWVYRSINLIVNLLALMVMAYAGLWMRNNVPSKADFRELQTQVISLDRSVLQMGEAGKRIEDFEQRIRKLEQGESRRFPPSRP